MVNHTAPLTVAPSPGAVMKTLIGEPVGCCTLTLRVAVAVRPAPSCTVAASVCGPSATVVASQLKDAVAAGPAPAKICAPSALSVHTSGAQPPGAESREPAAPPAVAASVGTVND